MADDDLAALSGFTEDFFKSVPELWKIYKKARDKGWAPQKLLAEMRDTKWFKKTSDSAREARLLKTSNPAEYKQRIDQLMARMRAIGAQTGARLTDKTLRSLASGALAGAWTEEQIRAQLAGRGEKQGYFRDKVRSGFLGGESGRALDMINERIAQQGVTVSNNTKAIWVRDIAAGTTTIENAFNSIDNAAIKQFPGLADRIRAGETVADVAAPYLETMSSLLEMAPADINLKDRHIRGALNVKTKDGYDIMSLTDFETRIREDPRWMKTGNAREAMMTQGREFLSMMGLVA